MMSRLRKMASDEIFDYSLLTEASKDYKKPRNKITHLLDSGDIVRVKKGLYVFGEAWRQQPICLEALANLIYGPSYISQEYALSFYGMIPERAETVTSMTTGKTKSFETPLGCFHYQHLMQNKYVTGIDFRQIDAKHSVFMALPEKALADHLAWQYDIKTENDLFVYLIENLRIDEMWLKKMRSQLVLEIAEAYQNPRINLLLKLIRKHHA